MTYIKANWQGIEDCGGRFERCGNLLGQYNDKVKRAKNALSLQIKLQTNYDNRLAALNNRMAALQRDMNEMKNVAKEVARRYRETEQHITGETDAISGPHCWVTPIPIPATWDIIHDLFPGVREGIESTTSSSSWWEVVTGTSEFLFDNADELFEMIGIGAETVEGFTTIAPWISTIIGVGAAAYGNYQEYQNGEIDADRAFRETVMEFVVDNGIELALTAACGVPGILVSVGMNVAQWAAEEYFGIDITEEISDAILDTGEAIADAVDSAVSTVAEWGSDVVDAAGEFFDDIGEKIRFW